MRIECVVWTGLNTPNDKDEELSTNNYLALELSGTNFAVLLIHTNLVARLAMSAEFFEKVQ